MVIDTSAIIAVLMNESEQPIFRRIIASEPKLAMSAVTLHETAVVMAGKKRTPSAAELVDIFVREVGIDISAAAVDDALAAREAYFRFGRGYHAARLNLADCFSYALAKTRNDTLLFKGNDFSKTDIAPAWRPEE